MKLSPQPRLGLTLVEMMVTTLLIGVLGLVIYSLLSTGTILGAKNTAVNTAHQRARNALLRMTRTIHAAVSPSRLVDVNGNLIVPAPAPGVSAPGISFQLWAGGPYKITADTADAWQTLTIDVTGTPTPPTPTVGQRVIIPTYGVESDITAVSGTAPGSVTLTLTPPAPAPPPVPAATPVPITGTAAPTNYNITCFITDRCSYIVNSKGDLEWRRPASSTTPIALATGIRNAAGIAGKPFALLSTATSIALSVRDSKSSNRAFQATDLGLNEIVALRTDNPPLATLP